MNKYKEAKQIILNKVEKIQSGKNKEFTSVGEYLFELWSTPSDYYEGVLFGFVGDRPLDPPYTDMHTAYGCLTLIGNRETLHSFSVEVGYEEFLPSILDNDDFNINMGELNSLNLADVECYLGKPLGAWLDSFVNQQTPIDLKRQERLHSTSS